MRIKLRRLLKRVFPDQVVPRAPFIANYLHGRLAAVALTFDDGTQDHTDVAVPILDQFGYKGTFFMLPGLTRQRRVDPFLPGSSAEGWGGASWEDWRIAHAHGHEVANHSATHQDLTVALDDVLADQVEGAARLIEENVGVYPESFAYPWNRFNQRARSHVLKSHPFDRSAHDICFNGRTPDLRELKELLNKAVDEASCLISMFHGIDTDPEQAKRRTYSIPRESFVMFLKLLKKREQDIWVDTFANLSRYVRLRETAQFSAHVVSENQVEILLTSELNTRAFNSELTVVVPTGKRVRSAQASYSDSGQLIQDVSIGRSNVLVNIRPNQGKVTVQWR